MADITIKSTKIPIRVSLVIMPGNVSNFVKLNDNKIFDLKVSGKIESNLEKKLALPS